MEWSDLRIFLAVAKEGSLGAAARQLGLSQPTVGRRLRALEEAIGQPLFQRGDDGVVLTDEGASVLPRAERIEAETVALQRELSGRDPKLEGVIRLSSSHWFGEHLLTPVLAEFASLQPGLVVELITSARAYSLQRREADLVFRVYPFDDSEVVSRRLMSISYAAYIRKGATHPAAGNGAGTALVTMDMTVGAVPDAVWLKGILPNATVSARSNNRDVQARMCALGAGLAVLPRPLGDSIADIEPVDLGEEPPHRDTWLGYHRDQKRQSRLQALLDLLVARLAN
ncbi:LysR family transcriptional regulator [Variovorax saccharolyticus]|uniref:LysR family transcriptional regulator n=1 Tax=Variovorax saccharolyticus TaxID=3053516 RepID=UPI0025788F21|nr:MULTISPECIES: LysR family transcriptional regulator [unclassified Variovorax]MDM0021469.1 LysR family transcriptional regulator [Variovorax sp. J22R187]MDM0027475.1 LysR family transcriptional regulator [Variovorax sp. J31P216]